jgi:hypothetical protein
VQEWQCGPRLDTARDGNRRFGPLSALRTHTKAPYKMDFNGKTLRALNRPGRARTVPPRKASNVLTSSAVNTSGLNSSHHHRVARASCRCSCCALAPSSASWPAPPSQCDAISSTAPLSTSPRSTGRCWAGAGPPDAFGGAGALAAGRSRLHDPARALPAGAGLGTKLGQVSASGFKMVGRHSERIHVPSAQAYTACMGGDKILDKILTVIGLLGETPISVSRLRTLARRPARAPRRQPKRA